LIAYLIAVHSLLVYLLVVHFAPSFISFTRFSTGQVPDPTEERPVSTPLPVPSLLSDLTPEPSEPLPAEDASAVPPAGPATGGLLIPVAGVRRDQLRDTFSEARSEGLVHEAIDIPAPLGTPVLAAGDGTIVKFWDSERGGITIYQLSSDQKYFYYYAHLQRRSESIKEGDKVKQGSVIGYVGDTGNAGSGNYHLHFGVSIVTDPKRYWEGTNVNPYYLLRGP